MTPPAPPPARPQGTDLAERWWAAPEHRRWTCPVPPDVRGFHASLPGFAATPAVDVPALAEELRVGRVVVKDESQRLGVGAFKILGASWAACRAVTRRLRGTDDPALVRRLGLPGVRDLVGQGDVHPVLVTATDGNHGRAVARAASWLGLRARVVLPAGVPDAARARIEAEGADIEQTDLAYDDAVAHAAADAEATGAILVQDTAWDGYTDVPGWIVEGYETMFAELTADHECDLLVVPTGVGSVLQAAVAHARSGALRPGVLCVEPTTAACVLRSVQAGRRVSVPTPGSVMNGLSCGSVSTLAWPYVRDGLDAAVTVTDTEALDAVDRLHGLGRTTGANGAAALAGARLALTGPGSGDRRRALDVGPRSTVALLNTEGFAD